ncbi:MAG: hypothetical protein K8S97_09380 [Anaerolineae bacterium]|nr:hypothetical protein [Anaerolineae bacterium]
MSDQQTANYPDVLGGITRGARVNLDVVQAAIAMHPAQVLGGEIVEGVLLLQNASDGDIDVTIKLAVPQRDQAKQKNQFVVKGDRVMVGLSPAQVGFVLIPVFVAPTTKPGTGYEMTVTLDVKRLTKKPQRVRLPAGGGKVSAQHMDAEALEQIKKLQPLSFGTDTGGRKNRLQTTFDVLPEGAHHVPLGSSQASSWTSIWTMGNLADDTIIAHKVWDTAQTAIGLMKRDTLFMPLLKTTQERFQTCGYPLLPPEVIFITKVLMLMLEADVTPPSPADPRPSWPRWFTQLCRVLIREPALAAQPEPVVTRLLYTHLVYDAVMYGFAAVSNTTKENFGDVQETSHYAEGLVEALGNQGAMDMVRVYLPLIMAGVIAGGRVTMPREQLRETVFTLSKALEKRQSERSADNAFVFDITRQLIERAMDTF